jgi:uncharacterized protein (DUF305 family)
MNTERLRIRVFLAALVVIAAASARTDPVSAAADVPAAMTMRMASQSPLEISTAHPFAALMNDIDQRMHADMAHALRTGDADHDFASAMIPHHQGAIDMARVELLYGKDPVLRRMAQEIIVTQQQEIDVMQRQIGSVPSSRVRNESDEKGQP